MRKLACTLLTAMAVALVGCVTINVYFPEAAAQKAADRFIGTVIDQGAAPAKDAKPAQPAQPPAQPSAMLLDLLVPAAQAAETPDIRVQTPAAEAIRGRMQARFSATLKSLLDAGAVGFSRDGLVAVRDAGKIPLSQRAQASAAVADENNDRNALYREVARANGHPEWEPKIRDTFAKGWIERAHAGWYYQDASGAWKQK
ncbi:MAG TPA: YdbL family protein [Frateuria sp.]|uniref:YdbL family protein n=1 Tax=Frateuria sp. TaxID=2211372 RepID=UPI002DF5746E|nr:YdbL family protein [Frateuria sp.]